MSDSILEHILFWSIGYGSLTGLAYAPLLMQQADSWFLRFVMLGLSVPMAAFITTALSVSVYGYGVFMQILSGILVQPLFMHSMIHTVCFAFTIFSGYNLFMKSVEDKVVLETESESSESSEDESESEQMEESESGSEVSETSESEWRATANFDGLRMAPPLPE